MGKSKTVERLMRLLFILVGVGLSIGLGALLLPPFQRVAPHLFEKLPYLEAAVYVGLSIIGAVVFFFWGLRSPNS
jgi:hypothetical protein